MIPTISLGQFGLGRTPRTVTAAFDPAPLPDATVGAAYTAQVDASGGIPPYTYAVTTGALPTGLSLNTSTGAITGTPTTAATGVSFTVRATDSEGNTSDASETVDVAAAVNFNSIVLALGPAAYWPMDEASGTTMYDAGPNGLNGTYDGSGVTVGATPLRPGSTGSMQITTAGNGAQVADAVALRVAASGTWSVVSIANIASTPSTSQLRSIVMKPQSEYSGHYAFMQCMRGAHDRIASGTLTYITGGGTPTGGVEANAGFGRDTDRAHVFVSVRRSDGIYTYVDGAQRAFIAITSGGVSYDAGAVRIGKNDYPGSYGVNGRISDVALFDFDLSTTQINDLVAAAEIPAAQYLDEISPAPTWAGGVVKLVSTATVAIRVRRSSDNAEQDIGFLGDYLDVPALLSFVGANSGYVTTIYDQMGGNNAVQATSANQPRIVNSGTFDTCIRFDGSNDTLRISSVTMGTQYCGVYARAYSPSAGSVRMVVSSDNTGAYNRWALYQMSWWGGILFDCTDSDGNRAAIQPNTDARSLWVGLSNTGLTGSSEVRIYYDGITGALGTGGAQNEQTGTYVTSFVDIGSAGTSYYNNMDLESLVLYNADSSGVRTSIEVRM